MGDAKRDGKEENKVHVVYLTLLVIIFALFFVTYVAYDQADNICRGSIKRIYDGIETDPCLSQCLQPTYDNNTFIIGGFEYENNQENIKTSWNSD